MNALLGQGYELLAAAAAERQQPVVVTVAIVVIAVIFLIILGVLITFFGVWIRALASGVPLGFVQLIGMRLRKVPARLIVDAKIAANKAHLTDVTLSDLEEHYLAGGNVTQVVRALAAAREANMDFSFEHAAAIDLDGRDVLREVMHARGGRVIGPYGIMQDNCQRTARGRIS